MNNPPIKESAYNAMLSKNPQSSIAVITSSGNKILFAGVNPTLAITADNIPCTISYIFNMISKP